MFKDIKTSSKEDHGIVTDSNKVSTKQGCGSGSTSLGRIWFRFSKFGRIRIWSAHNTLRYLSEFKVYQSYNLVLIFLGQNHYVGSDFFDGRIRILLFFFRRSNQDPGSTHPDPQPCTLKFCFPSFNIKKKTMTIRQPWNSLIRPGQGI